ncbi:MAG: peptide chain release factor N(5)-glutamine methyltransferase [Planctomycetales bacterium]|nr:peptide chain release factor N(5)-glutamine methyltransferase [Planctomycetales bacterium]MBN8629055.1 peptide chain release factor N(5)-glutamine methyltransferase [Planctomycetota bacterium]
MSDPWTIGRLLTWTTGFLKDHGSDSPRLDAEVLLAHALGTQRIMLYTRFDEEPNETVRTQYRGFVKERANGKPVAYLVGKREFYSLDFVVTPDVLIPRPETEFLVVGLLDAAKSTKPTAGGGLQIADVGTGSGILAVCAALKIPQAKVTAIDVSPAALAVAERNAVAHGVTERIEFVESDLFAKVPAERKFDFIVSNPPYIMTSEMAELDRDVRDFEPHLALEAGPKGTEVIERLLPQAAERLVTGGQLFMEISPQIHDAVQTLLKADHRWEPLPTIDDQQRKPRIVRARRRA